MKIQSLNKASPGFTLIELLFVTFLFLLLAGLSSSMFHRSFDAFAEDRAVQDILDLMNFAHERAILERVDYGVHVVPNQNSYWLVRQNEKNTDVDLMQIPGTLGAAHRWPAGVEYKGTERSVVFYPDGTTDPTSLELVCHARRLTLVMDSTSGKGSIHETLE